MKSVGFLRGKSSPCVFWHSERRLRCVVHGDDFIVLGWKKDLDWFWKEMQLKFESKHRGRLGPSPDDFNAVRTLNRIVEWTLEGIAYEGDQRHVEICLRKAGIEESSRTVSTPTDKSDKLQKEPEYLASSTTTKYRGHVARMNHLGQDRSDIQHSVEELGKDMANSSKES